MNNLFDLKLQDCLIGLKEIDANSIDLCLTDPPYFLDGLDDSWDIDAITKKQNNDKGTVTSLPKGMKFDPQQGIKFQEFYNNVSKEIYRVMKPGGFFLSWSSPRLYHRMAVAMEDQGFEIRDMYAWIYLISQSKAMGFDRLIDLSDDIDDNEKPTLKKSMRGWKTPQIKSCIEPICFAQKPTDGTYLNNWTKYHIGLINTNQKVGDDKMSSNLITTEKINKYLDGAFLISKPSKKEKGDYNNHVSVKPLQLCEHIIKLLTPEKSIVLDPFTGSGTTGIAAYINNRNFIGFEINVDYYNITIKRLNDIKKDQTVDNGIFD